MSQLNQAATHSKDWGIVVNSIGTTDAGIIGALHKAIPVPQSQLAMKIYQAPSLLLGHLDKATAGEIDRLLNSIGLVTQVVHKDTEIAAGEGKLEVCLVAKEQQNMPDVLTNLQRFLGLPEKQGKSMLFQSPNVIMGKVSASTVSAIKQRFSGLGVDIQAAEAARSRYLLLLQRLSRQDKHQLERILSQYQLNHLLEDNSYISHQLDKEQADLIWPHIKRFGSKVKLVNQAFAQFDIRLEASRNTAGLLAVLEQHTEIPPHLLSRVVERAPIIIKHNTDFDTMHKLYQQLIACQAKVTVLPISLQYFRIALKELGQVSETQDILRWMTDCSEAQAQAFTRTGSEENILLTATQAHWLAHELEQVGTKITMSLEQLSA